MATPKITIDLSKKAQQKRIHNAIMRAIDEGEYWD